ncbi:MAG: cysteine desulfurase NifS [Verrucomicrobiales bacterium]|nr:cysteine desulfurase NifS [Verrucomicrobiales bacterium]
MIYLDHNATTPVDPAVLEAMEPFWRGHFANPGSNSILARPIKRALSTAREQCADLLGCDPAELIFTSGGTESLNTALHSLTTSAGARRHLIVGSTEHEAVLRPVAHLEAALGWEITRLPVDAAGEWTLTDLAAAIRPGETAAVVLMWANNETGVTHPIPQAAALAAAHGIPVLTDAVQAAGKVPLALNESGVQFAAFSGHKFNAPKGTGLLYVRANTAFEPLLRGGGQENGRRSGTENVAGIVGLGAAAKWAAASWERMEALAARRDHFENEVLRRIPGSHRNGHPHHRVPNTASLRFDGTQAEGLLLLLDQKCICASAGSACSTGSLHPSHVLTAMGLDPASARSTLRFSLGRTTTDEELATTVSALEAAVAKFRSLMPS